MKREQERNEDNLDRLVLLSERINWDCFCDEMENALPELKSFLATWGRHCGAPYMVFRGQLCKTILEIWKANSSINTTSSAGAK
jgi:hypothetical protein